ncbi:DUF2784 domain-containing protein [Dissulfurimicrobium hydrothermale]|nr:DUF2784 domain-containing protein [Dissulfurimicrobium hydrothermale]UKL14595.1 DUF2784 domain-containing protein [Dissulfurimicrobium hydrothermale]
MGYLICADVLVFFHLAFVAFVVAGGFLALRWRWIMCLHIPAAVWGALVEFNGWLCPLTPLEQKLRLAGGQVGYTGDFVGHYILPLLYPAGLTRRTQTDLGLLVVAINILIYGWMAVRSVSGRRRS